MKRSFRALLFTAVSPALAVFFFGVPFLTMGTPLRAEETKEVKKSLLIMFDGLRGDTLFSVPTPNLDSLRDGSWAAGYKGAWTFQAHTNLESRPSSATNHVAIITGVTATKNGCFQNGQTKDAKWGEFPSYLTRLHQFDPKLVTAWLHNWSENSDIPTDANFHFGPEGGFDGDMKLIDTAIGLINGTLPDQKDADGRDWKQGTDPDAIALYLDSMDMFGHSEGFSVFVPEYWEKLRAYDRRVGDLLTAIKNRPTFADESWMIVVVADHGGFGTEHGIVGCENCYTIPLVVTSKWVEAGRMKGQPQNCDVAAYLMKQMTGAIPPEFDGKIEAAVPDPAPNVRDGLLAVFPFEGDYKDTLGKVAATPGSKVPGWTDSGRIGQGLVLRDGAWLSLGKLPELKLGERKNFSFAFWFRTARVQAKDPPFLSNKDWKNGVNPGVALTANYGGDSGNNPFFNLADGTKRDDIGTLACYPDSRWRFIALTADRAGNAVFYLGDDAGKLAFVSDDISDLGNLDSGLDWNLGQDGTGSYDATVQNVKIDELGVWTRALTGEEIREVYRLGLEGKSLAE